jgi:Xaa-Pro dipeptidase
MPGDPQYLSGYDPQIEDGAFVVSERGLWIVGGPEGKTQADEQLKLGEFVVLEEFKLPKVDYVGVTFQALRDVLHLAANGPLEAIGLLTTPAVTSVEWLEMVRAAAGPGVRYEAAPDILRQARYEKSAVELDCLRVSNQIATAAFKAMLSAVRPGVTELDVAAHGDFVMKSLGAEGVGLSTIVLSGRRIDTIIGNASRKRIEAGEPVLMNASARYNGYCSAVGRTVVAGGANREQIAFFDHGVRAYELAAARLQPGTPACDVDLAARDHLAAAGLGAYHTYSVGHGTGLTECQEAEPLGRHSNYPIPRSVAIMIDVGIFGHPVYHGFRFEDSFLIDQTGAVERQTDIPMRLYAS